MRRGNRIFGSWIPSICLPGLANDGVIVLRHER